MATEVTTIKFKRDQAGARELQMAIDEVLTELADPESDSSELARSAGLNADELSQATISVDEPKEGIEPVSTTIAVGILVGVGAHIANKFWDDVIWPRIKVKLGAKAVGERKAD